MNKIIAAIALLMFTFYPGFSRAWHDETHVAVAKVAGYAKWFNAAGPDMIKVKAGPLETSNHYVNNDRGTIVTANMVLQQVAQYDQTEDHRGHLYGAIIASVKNYRQAKKKGEYGQYHLAFAVHYIGDLSQPLHNIRYNAYNRKNHNRTDGTVNAEVLNHLDRITIYDIHIASEMDLAREIARIANLSLKLGYKLEDEQRLLSKKQAYEQLSHSASLFKAVLKFVDK